MLWREKKEGTSFEEMELYVRKQRNGPLVTLKYDFDLPCGKILIKQWRESVIIKINEYFYREVITRSK